jgi:hypothetical protein
LFYQTDLKHKTKSKCGKKKRYDGKSNDDGELERLGEDEKVNVFMTRKDPLSFIFLNSYIL